MGDCDINKILACSPVALFKTYTGQNKERIQMPKKYSLQVHLLTFKKIDEDGNDDGKIYEYTGDHSSFCDGIEDGDLKEIGEKN